MNEKKSNYYGESPQILRDFLSYHETIQAHSPKTVDEYFLDLRTFFRFLKLEKGLVPRTAEFSEISILDVDIALVGSVTLTDVYSFMNYLSRDRWPRPGGPPARKLPRSDRSISISLIKQNYSQRIPCRTWDAPHLKKTLPRYLDLDQSIHLLESIDGRNRERDYCILTLFLNCGVRISELVGLNLTDVRGDQLRVLGKGNKERILFLNDACRQALDDWLAVRPSTAAADKNALFLTRRHTRMTTDAVHYMVKQRLKRAGLDASQYSSHKLRHTAATLMLQNGVDVRNTSRGTGA